MSYTISAKSNSFVKSNYSFQQIGIEKGLSQSSILSIIQDQKGYLWFGTASGLNRFDGYEFLVYLNDVNDPKSISGNEITALFEDKQGTIWIGTSEGILNKFERESNEFYQYDIAGSSDWSSSSEKDYYNMPLTFSRNQISTITTITQDNDGDLWIGTWGKGIVRFNPKNEKKKYYYHFKDKNNSLSSNKIVKLLNDGKNVLWVGTFGGGLNRITKNINNTDDIIIDSYKLHSEFLFGERVTTLYQDLEQNLFIGTYMGKIFKISKTEMYENPLNAKFDVLTSQIFAEASQKIFNIISITADQNSNLWIGTSGSGLFSYSEKLNKTEHFVAQSNNPGSLSENEIQSLFVDRSGILWIGTQLGSGINKLITDSQKFKTIPVKTINGKSLNDNIIWAIHQDKNNYIWFGTHRGGLNRWDKEKNEFIYFDKNSNLADNHIRAIAEDKSGNLWIGSFSHGLSFLDKNTLECKNFIKENKNPKSLNSNQIQTILNDGDSVLWIGTFGGGLNKLDLNKFYSSGITEFTSYVHNPIDNVSISDDRIYILHKNNEETLWVGTYGGGLNKFDIKTETFTAYKSVPNQKNTLSNNRIMTISETFDEKLLIGTFGGGLNLFDPQQNKVERFQDKISLNCSDVYGILSDKESGYWISTDNGIFNLDNEFSSFRQYDLSDGLQSLEFNGGAYSKGSDGYFYFGGINGVNYFYPKNIKLDDFLPPIVISGIKVFDEPINGEHDKLEFGMDKNYFSFEFASLDFKNSEKNKYQFILEGLDSKWTYADAKNRRVFYSNLAPGDYTFRVRGTNNDGIWSPYEANLEITILAPFWMQWWFISGLILLVGGLVTFFINQRIKYLVALDALKSNISADLHDNIGAGLTEISILSELAANEIHKQKFSTKHLNQISDLSRQLVESMSDIVWVVNPNRDSLYDLIVRLKDTYGELLTDLGIKLETTDLDNLTSVKLPMDYRQNLYLILKESINNAIKHSKCTKIEIEIKVLRNSIFVVVSDNGIGFDPKKIVFGNGINNIKERGKKINGIINIFSDIKNGTKIKFSGTINK